MKTRAILLATVMITCAILAGCTSGPHPGPNNPTPAPDGKDGKESPSAVKTSGPHPVGTSGPHQ